MNQQANTILKLAARVMCVLAAVWLTIICESAVAATLSAVPTPIAPGSNVNLSVEGKLDWVHWGLDTEYTITRKATVSPKISHYVVLYNQFTSYVVPYQQTDAEYGFTWADGFQTPGVTNTPIGVYVQRPFIPNDVNGFQFTVPAGTATNQLKVYLGAYQYKGRFQASLSDNSATAISDTSLANYAGATGAVYAVNFAAASPGQTLTVKWTLDTSISNGVPFTASVSLQAAALSAAGSNNPPYAEIVSPVKNQLFTAPANITISATATDFDGAVSKVEFFRGTNKLGEVTNSPYDLNWPNAPAGNHVLTARVTDNNGASSVSAPVEVFVNGTGGSLAGSSDFFTTYVDLTAEGTKDWRHWGFEGASNSNHKAGVVPVIPNFTKVGTNALQRQTNSVLTTSWSDGTPTPTADSTEAAFIYGVTNGFVLTVPADTNLRTLKIYAGLSGARGSFQAFLGDFSAPAFTDTSVSNLYNDAHVAYSLNYAAASAGQTLTVRWIADRQYDGFYGNVTLQAATLTGGNFLPGAVITSPANGAIFVPFTNLTIQASASDADGSVSKVEFFQGASKLGEATNNPYSLIWSNVPAGAYSLTAKATDDEGATFTSLPANVSIVSVAFSNLVFAGDGAGFSLDTQSNRSYSVQFTDSFNPANWQPLTNFTGTGNVMSVMDPNAPVSKRFYRVIVQ
ncbi:MAG TPA: Ig-like domain-containing protein [Verrucomicrobiae bacterium]|jgi:hypothetical protein